MDAVCLACGIPWALSLFGWWIAWLRVLLLAVAVFILWYCLDGCVACVAFLLALLSSGIVALVTTISEQLYHCVV